MKDVDDFLNHVREIDKHIKLLHQRKDALRLCLYPSGICYDGVKVQTSPTDKTPDIMADIAEYDEKIKRLQDLRINHVKTLEKEFRKLEDINQITALTGYYAACKSVRELSDEMGYSKSAVWYFIRKGAKTLNVLDRLDTKSMV